MRSVTTRLFAAIVAVAVVALAIGTWWVRRTVESHLGVVIEQTVERRDGREIVREERRETGARPAGAPANAAALTQRLLLALAAVVLGAAGVTALIARRVLGPVHALRNAAEAMAEGRLDTRVPERGGDELVALARAFNAMAASLGESERLKRDLTNDIAHELRTPLTDLRCHVEAMQDGVVDATPDALAGLHAQLAHLQRLVEDVGDLARAESRQLRLEPESVPVAAAVAQAVSQVQARAAKLGVTLDGRIDAALPPMLADRARLHQVLTNLIDNAVAHTPAGGVVTVAARRDASDIVLEVRDTGTGIAPEHLPRVFDRFYRADPSRSRDTGGAGLGLAVARQVVEASGGRITAASAPGAETVFEVRWPASFTSPS